MNAFEDFDRFCEERGVADEDGVATAEAFAEWLASKTGAPIIGGPVGEAPTIIALPEDE